MIPILTIFLVPSKIVEKTEPHEDDNKPVFEFFNQPSLSELQDAKMGCYFLTTGSEGFLVCLFVLFSNQSLLRRRCVTVYLKLPLFLYKSRF